MSVGRGGSAIGSSRSCSDSSPWASWPTMNPHCTPSRSGPRAPNMPAIPARGLAPGSPGAPEVEGDRSGGQSMGVKISGDPGPTLGDHDAVAAVPAAATVVITGVSGFLGQAVLRRLAGSPAVSRVIGLDVREPGYRPRSLQFHLVDVAGSDLRPLVEGADVLVHLAGVHDAIPDEELMARVNVGGTRRVLEAAGAAGVAKVVLVSSAAVYGAWSNNPVPLTEDAPLRPNPGFPLGVHKAELERLLAEWVLARPAAVTTILRPAFVLGARADHAGARLIQRRTPLAVGGSVAPVQFVHEDDATEAIALAVERDLPGVYNVAAEGWLTRDELRALVGRKVQPT